jgi:molecular chaperone DnaK (HSP70)
MSAHGYQAVVASSKVLRQLVKESGEEVKRVVISVPAYFSDNQRQGTIQAAEYAGLEVVELINEPTAAAIYASRNRKALSLIFDLGGGTFDVTVIDTRFGDYDVQATSGCMLGGDDFDKQIFQHIIGSADVKIHKLGAIGIAKLMRDCTKLKIRVQKSMQDEKIDLAAYGAGEYTLAVDTYIKLMKRTFSPAIEKARHVLGESILVGEKFDLILVGGSTRCPYLRDWVTQEMGQKPVDMFYDPDFIVAQGAAVYAQMVNDGIAGAQVSDVTQALSICMADGSARVLILRNSKIPVMEQVTVVNDTESDRLQLDLYQGDNIVAEKNEHIGQLIYSYNRVVPKGEGDVTVSITVKRSGTITLSCKELLGKSVEVVLERNASRS